MGYLLPKALIVMHEGPEWAVVRKLLLNAITGHSLDSLLPTLSSGMEMVGRLVSFSRARQVIDYFFFLRGLTLGSFCK